jgi:hypothetical protein
VSTQEHLKTPTSISKTTCSTTMSVLKAYPGSCHCGKVQYQLKLKFPPDMTSMRNEDTIRIYKCNCTVCQKMGFFHCRPITPAEDFILMSDPTELGEYRASTKKCAWYFCKDCGCRVVGVVGEWVEGDLHVEQWAGTKKEQDGDALRKVWKTKGKMITTEVDGMYACNDTRRSDKETNS